MVVEHWKSESGGPKLSLVFTTFYIAPKTSPSDSFGLSTFLRASRKYTSELRRACSQVECRQLRGTYSLRRSIQASVERRAKR
jgi:hypothetical protein